METKNITRSLQGYLSEYRTFPNIQRLLHFCGIDISEREFADYVESYRQEEHEYYLESCSKGYRFTRDKNSIRKSCWQRIKKAISMIKNALRDLKNLGEKSQLTLFTNYVDSMEEAVERIEIVEGVSNGL